jgi:excisionase family DNA binding protein
MTTTHALPVEGLKLLSLREVADLLRVARVTIYRLVARRALPVYRIARRLCFREHDVREWLERRRTDSAERC